MGGQRLLSKSSEYAIRASLYVASQQILEQKKQPGIKQISEALSIPAHYLGKLLQILTRHNLLSSTKGPTGGFFFSPEQQTIPLINLVEVFDGKQIFKRCGLGLKLCSETHPCPLHNDYAPVRDGFEKALSAHTILGLLESLENGDTFLVSQ